MSVDEIVAKLKESVDQRVELTFLDGEVLIADIQFVIEEDDSIIFELVESNKPEKYERSDMRPTLRARISEIVGCDPQDGFSGQVAGP